MDEIMDDQEAVELLLERMVGQVIESAGIEDDEFVMELADGTRVILFSDEDLQLYYEFKEQNTIQ
jgi:hypothetical protein